jgi:hypothetical protein
MVFIIFCILARLKVRYEFWFVWDIRSMKSCKFSNFWVVLLVLEWCCWTFNVHILCRSRSIRSWWSSWVSLTQGLTTTEAVFMKFHLLKIKGSWLFFNNWIKDLPTRGMKLKKSFHCIVSRQLGHWRLTPLLCFGGIGLNQCWAAIGNRETPGGYHGCS